MRRLKIVTWNINSVRLRLKLVTRLLRQLEPDVLCLQETKTPNDRFPKAAFKRVGYPYVAVNGQRGYHGVATISRLPLLDVHVRPFCGKEDGRYLRAGIEFGGGQVAIHNLYVPAGGDEPDPAINPKFAHKLAFLDEMHDWLPGASAGVPDIVVGDLNVAPGEADVWSHRQLLKVVSHTPPETERLNAVIRVGGWVDLARRSVPADQKLFTWWSYRNQDWRKSDRGRRLDHIWAAPALADRLAGFTVLKDARDYPRPSDHVPVIAEFLADAPVPAPATPGAAVVEIA